MFVKASHYLKPSQNSQLPDKIRFRSIVSIFKHVCTILPLGAELFIYSFIACFTTALSCSRSRWANLQNRFFFHFLFRRTPLSFLVLRTVIKDKCSHQIWHAGLKKQNDFHHTTVLCLYIKNKLRMEPLTKNKSFYPVSKQPQKHRLRSIVTFV